MNSGKILVAELHDVEVLKLVGDIRVVLSSTIDAHFHKLYEKPHVKAVLVDLTDTQAIDSTTLGLLAKLAIQMKKRFDIVPTIVSTRDDITKILLSMSCDKVANIVREPLEEQAQFGELAEMSESEKIVRQRVIEVHKILMALSDENRAKFKDLVNALSMENDA